MGKNKLPTTSVRLPVELRIRLEELAKEKEMTMSDVLIEALAYYVYHIKK